MTKDPIKYIKHLKGMIRTLQAQLRKSHYGGDRTIPDSEGWYWKRRANGTWEVVRVVRVKPWSRVSPLMVADGGRKGLLTSNVDPSDWGGRIPEPQ